MILPLTLFDLNNSWWQKCVSCIEIKVTNFIKLRIMPIIGVDFNAKLDIHKNLIGFIIGKI